MSNKLAKFCSLIIISLLFALLSCNNNSEKIPDVKNIHISLQTLRFDTDLFAIDTNHVAEGLQKLLKKYPDFLNYYLDTVMAYGIHGNYADTTGGIKEGLHVFLTYKDFVELEDSIKKHYPDTKDLDEALTSGFKLMKYYFPGSFAPRIIYLNMGLSKWPSFPLDTTTTCIGLDMFLGDHYPFYASVGVPDYMASHLRKSYIPVSVFSTIYKIKHPYIQDERTLLDLMLQRGKEQYFLHKILPLASDSVLFGFTQLQVDWCNKNEADIYNFFVRNKMLYNKESIGRFGYVNDGPFAQGIEPQTDTVKYSPGNVGTLIGYKIVVAYMKKYPNITLSELINQRSEPSRFLDSAKYRPK